MSFITVGLTVGMGVYKAVQGANAAKDAKIQADNARDEMEKHKAAFEALDTSNPYSNLENTMEDLTVNQQQAEFEKQNNMQNQANVMGQMRGAAGSSGIAALAQSLSNSGSLNAQKASASIGAQEAQNQQLSAAEASKNQGLEREGEVMSRDMKFGKTQSLMSMSAGDVSNAQAMQAAGNQQMMAGIGDAVGGVASGIGAMGGGADKTTETTDTTTVPVVGGTAQVGGISTPQNITGQTEVTGATGGGDTSWNTGNDAPQFGYVNGVWQQING